MNEPEQVVVPMDIAASIIDYQHARKERLEAERLEKLTKALILAALGYEPEDPKPLPLTLVSPNGHEMARVTVGTWRGLDTAYLKDRYPHIYAECEKTKATLQIRETE